MYELKLKGSTQKRGQYHKGMFGNALQDKILAPFSVIVWKTYIWVHLVLRKEDIRFP